MFRMRFYFLLSGLISTIQLLTLVIVNNLNQIPFRIGVAYASTINVSTDQTRIVSTTQSTGTISGNTINVTGSPTIQGWVTPGLSWGSASITNNFVNISGGVFQSFVAGGYSINGAVTQNTVTLTGGEFDSNVHGGVSINNTVSYNTVIIQGSGGTAILLKGGSIRGGTSTNGSSLYNSISITNAEIGNNTITGGYSNSGLVSGNTVTLNDVLTSTGDTTVYAGHALGSNSSTNNILSITTGTFSSGSKVYGGSSATGDVTGNSVTVTNSTIEGSVVGGESSSGSVANNSILLQGANSHFIDALVVGGEATSSGAVSNNTLTIEAGTYDGTILLAARTETGNATNNTLTINAGIFENDLTSNNYTTRISAGQSRSGTASYNITYINGGTFYIDTVILGANTFSGIATNNTLYISDGVFKAGSVAAGAYAQSGVASNNTVYLNGRAEINGLVAGGYTESGTVTDNNIFITSDILTDGTSTGIISAGAASSNSANIYNNTITVESSSGTYGSIDFGGTSLYGSYVNDGISTLATTSSYSSQESNTLIVKSQATNLDNVANFDTYVFYVDSMDQDYRVEANTIDLGTDATVSVYLSDKSAVLYPGEAIKLFQTPTTTDEISGNIGQARVYQGVSLVSDLMIDTGTAGNIRDLIVKATTANSLARTFPEARLASFAFVNQADDLILGQGIASAIESTNLRVNKWVTFGAIDIGTSSYTTESDLTGDITFGGVTMVTGLSRKIPFAKSNLLTGIYLEAGTGFIDTENLNDDLDSIQTGGDTNFYGVGFFSRYDFGNGFYAGLLARIGILATDFDTRDSMNELTYSANTPYYGLGVSTGYQFTMFQNRDSVDLYTRYMWTQLAQKEMMIDDQEYDFDAINSHQLRVGGQYNFNHMRSFSPFVGMAAQYDFDGEASATVRKIYPTSTPQLQGLTGLFEVGVRYKPISKVDTPVSISMNFEYFVGRRRGMSGTMDVEYSF